MRNYRSTLDWSKEKYSKPEAYLDLMALANWEDKTWCGISIKRGSFITSKEALATRWMWTRQSVIRYLKRLEKAAIVRTSSVRGPDRMCTLIEVLDYERIQSSTDPSEVVCVPGPHAFRTQTVQEPTPTKEEEIIIRNKISNKSITRVARTSTPKDQYGEFVFLTKLEHEKFVAQFGIDYLNAAIEKLNSWIGSNPIPKRKTNGKNAAATFRTWVFNALDEQRAKTTKSNGYQPHTAASTFEHNLKYLRSTQNEPIDLERLFNVFSECEEEPSTNPRIGGGMVSSTRKLIG